MKRIKFLETYTVKAAGGPTYEKGSIYETTDAAGLHFISRRLAVEVAEQPKPEPAPEPVSLADVTADPVEVIPKRKTKEKADAGAAFKKGQAAYEKKFLGGE